jgi:hypothetical protein
MIASMERIRVYFDAEEALRLALKSEALKAGRSVSDLISEILKREFAKAVEEARKTLRDREKKQKP